MTRFRFIEGAFRDCCLRWGCEEVRTPTLEYLHLFTATGTLTPGMLGKVYSFLDWDGWSGERVVLRPDGTIPVARLFIEGMKDRDFAKLCYVSNIFIFEETGKESRERWQGGVELIGAGSPLADVELIALALEALAGMGLKGLKLKLSHSGLIRGLLHGLGMSPGEEAEIFDRILDGDAAALAAVKAGKPELNEALSLLLKLKGKSSAFLKNSRGLLARSLPQLESALDDFIDITSLLEVLGCDYKIDLASGRGFEYYTGVIFHIFAGREKVGGGGRYDALIPLMGGKDIPASGFALYFDHLMKLAEPSAAAEPAAVKVAVHAGPEAIKQGFDAVSRLHKEGYITQFGLDDNGMADADWRLDIRGETPRFELTDAKTGRKRPAETVEDVLALLKRG